MLLGLTDRKTLNLSGQSTQEWIVSYELKCGERDVCEIACCVTHDPQVEQLKQHMNIISWTLWIGRLHTILMVDSASGSHKTALKLLAWAGDSSEGSTKGESYSKLRWLLGFSSLKCLSSLTAVNWKPSSVPCGLNVISASLKCEAEKTVEQMRWPDVRNHSLT